MEDITKGERVRKYELYGLQNNQWKLLSTGSCVGHKRIEVVNGEQYSSVRLNVTEADGQPVIEKMVCF